ncbi:unnamed protein product [Cylicocyclus nassatus]|uniref:Uncharacterized protein n=1 Tax=Cylicocyclus nassatus TaxID=53992 RepID=A0AA36DTD0_CYLNA|nr:unnamed protein product [Cylicocyclus nassatus]
MLLLTSNYCAFSRIRHVAHQQIRRCSSGVLVSWRNRFQRLQRALQKGTYLAPGCLFETLQWPGKAIFET